MVNGWYGRIDIMYIAPPLFVYMARYLLAVTAYCVPPDYVEAHNEIKLMSIYFIANAGGG